MSRTSKTAEHMSQFHCCTKCAGCAQPFLRWGCTIRSRSCSFPTTSASGAVGRTQCTCLLSKLICGTVNANNEISAVHSMGALLGFGFQGSWAVVGGDSSRGWLFGLLRKYKTVHQKTHPEEILTIFFTRGVRAVCHRVKNTGRKEVWGSWKNVDFRRVASYLNERKKPCGGRTLTSWWHVDRKPGWNAVQACGESKINYMLSSELFRFGNRLGCELELACALTKRTRDRGIIGLWAEDLRMKPLWQEHRGVCSSVHPLGRSTAYSAIHEVLHNSVRLIRVSYLR